jgi:hypothetical protein
MIINPSLLKRYKVKDKNGRNIARKVIKTRYKELIKNIQCLLVMYQVEEQCSIDYDLLWDAVIDYFEDVARMKDFHDIEHTEIVKIISYQAFWLVRNKPIQIVNNAQLPEKKRHINEAIFSYLLVNNIATELQSRIEPNIQIDNFVYKLMNHPLMIELRANLYYNFRYRQQSPKSLLLFVEGFMSAAEFTLQIT